MNRFYFLVLLLCVEDEGQEQRLRELVDPKRGILVEIATDTKVPGPRRARWKRSDPSSLCNLEVARFTCEDKTPDAARFTCSTIFPNEHYYFVWRRNNGAAYIEKISGTLEDCASLSQVPSPSRACWSIGPLRAQCSNRRRGRAMSAQSQPQLGLRLPSQHRSCPSLQPHSPPW